jgi:mannose-6-phosphate isomerase-like protein (cupin superfamily)
MDPWNAGRQGFVKDPTRARAEALPMFVRNAKDVEPFVAADLSEIRPLIDRSTTAIASVSVAHATLAPGAQTIWHRLDRTDEIYFILAGRGLVSVGGESREVSAGDTVWIPAGMEQRIRNLGPDPLKFLCACGPAYLPELDRPDHALALAQGQA